MNTRGKGIFITGTDTGVGKTYVACGIAKTLRKKGIDVGVMKPAETGCLIRSDKLVPRDALKLIKAAGVRDPIALVNPYRFRKPLAPAVAAELEEGKISLNKIITVYRALSRKHDFMIVEGAGGILVPLADKKSYLDLAQALELPVVIVARPGLGTINHTLLTISALNERGISIAGVIINYAHDQKTGLAERTNPSVIKKISGVRVLGTMPYGSNKFDLITDELK